MRCSVCGAETESPFCPNCGAAMQSPAGDPPAIAVLRTHARSKLMAALLLLQGLLAVLQVLAALTHNGTLINLSVNGQYSLIGSLVCTLGLLALVFFSFLKLYRAAGQEPGTRLPAVPATLGKIFAVIALIFACLLCLGTLAVGLALLLPGSSLAGEFSTQLNELMPDVAYDFSTMLSVGFALMLLLSVLELLSAVSLLRTVNAAKRMLKTGVAARLSKLCAVTLLINAGLLLLLDLLNLSAASGLWDLLSELPLAACLACFALLILRARADLDRAFAPAAPAAAVGPELP